MLLIMSTTTLHSVAKNHKLKTQKCKKNLRLWLKFIMTHFIPWAVRFTENSVRPTESDVGTGHAQKNR